jgi:hypothetical protein
VNRPGPSPLREGYYLDNFEAVLRDVRERYGGLLNPRERERTEAFLALPLGARRLYVRMLTRKGPWFRRDGLRYPEIPDLEGALADLAGAGLCGAGASPAERAALLRRDELQALLAGLGRPGRRTRDQLAAELLAADPGALLAALDPVTPLEGEWARLCCFLFFGNGEQDLTEFVLADLGRTRYEAYALDPDGRLFVVRADVDFLLDLGRLRDQLDQAQAQAGADADPAPLARLTEALLATSPRPGVRQQRRFHRLLADLGRAWERRGDPARALACYHVCRRPPARERTVRLLAAAGQRRRAADLAAAMAEAPWDAGEERFADRFLRRLARHENLAAAWVLGHPEPEPIPQVDLRLPRHPSGSVERAALVAAEADGWTGYFTENALWRGLFGLAFWDLLFAPVPGAFQHRFQSAPADLAGPEFYERRRPAIAARLEQLAAPGAFARAVRATAEAKRGLANLLVAWRALPPELLETVLAALPGPAAVSVLAAMAPSPLALASGFPALVLVKEGRCRLWEVKGPGDVLRPEQERWLRHFHRAGLEARVARVAYLD